MNTLSQHYLQTSDIAGNVTVPDAHLWQLPERVLQFGTGVLLRGLTDYLIDKANRQGIFNGRIVVVKSTDGGDSLAFDRQDNLYTLCVRGVEMDRLVEENIICSAISRVLSAKSQWADVLQFAASPDLQVVISNTTEVGIQLVDDSIQLTPPVSFPGKLLAVLHARYQAFNGATDKGLVIVPTELIPENGTKLRVIVLELARRNALDTAFIQWLETANRFCNSLVDRIVPGRPDRVIQQALAGQLGYEDDLLILSEAYRLWAIEAAVDSAAVDSAAVDSAAVDSGDEWVPFVLSFHQADEGVVIRPNIDLFRELKLRLLNGTHTLSCGLAVLCGFETVSASLDDDRMDMFVRNLMLADLVPGIPYAIDDKVAQRFGMQVLDRFRNPYIEHRWLSITMQYTAKMRLRNLPTLLHYYEHRPGSVPKYMALGFAAYLLFMRATHRQDDAWFGECNGADYLIQDDKAPYFADLWTRLTPDELTTTVLQNATLWEYDLTTLPGFADAVRGYLNAMITHGTNEALALFLNKKESRTTGVTG